MRNSKNFYLGKSLIILLFLMFFTSEVTAQKFYLHTSHPYAGIQLTDGTPFFIDYDKDGDQDFFLFGSNSTIYYYEYNNGGWDLNNNFKIFPNFIFGNFHGAVADFDNDNDFDFFLVKDGQSQYLENNGGTFTVMNDDVNPLPNLTNSYGTKILPGDLNKDGRTDFVISNDKSVKIYINQNGLLEFRAELTGGNFNGSSPAIGDIDYDNDLDIVVGNNNGELMVFENNGGTFTKTNQVEIKNVKYTAGDDIALFHINNDPYIDFVVSGKNGILDLYINHGDCDYKYVTYNDIPIVSPSNQNKITFYDYDNDNDEDMFISSSEGIKYFENKDNQYIESNSIDIVNQIHAFEFDFDFVDFDNDGDDDIFGGSKSNIHLYKNNNGTFQDITSSSENPFKFIKEEHPFNQKFSPVLVDLNQDLVLDVVLGSRDRDGLDCYINNNGVYEKYTDNPICSYNFSNNRYFTPTLYDYDNDKDIDIICGSQNGTLYVFQNNNGDFELINPSNAPFGSKLYGRFTDPSLTDINQDLYLDAIVTTGDRAIYHYISDTETSSSQLSKEESTIKLYPNITSDMVTLELDQAIKSGKISIYNMKGEVVYHKEVQNNASFNIDVSTLTPAQYILSLRTDSDFISKQFTIIK